MPQLVALIGPAGSGKTILAKQLSLWQNFIRKPFAEGLKGMLRHFLQSQGLDHNTVDRMVDGDLKEIPSECLCGKTSRYAMQTLGTEWRNMLGRDLWVNAWEQEVRMVWKSTDVHIIVDDMRFLHEAERVRAMGGKIVHIHRENSIIDYPLHQSEIEWRDIVSDYTIVNNGSPERMLEMFSNMGIVPDA